MRRDVRGLAGVNMKAALTVIDRLDIFDDREKVRRGVVDIEVFESSISTRRVEVVD